MAWCKHQQKEHLETCGVTLKHIFQNIADNYASSLIEDAALPAAEDLVLRADRIDGWGTGGGFQAPLDPASLIGGGLGTELWAPYRPAPPLPPPKDKPPPNAEGGAVPDAARSHGCNATVSVTGTSSFITAMMQCQTSPNTRAPALASHLGSWLKACVTGLLAGIWRLVINVVLE